jgi:WD40 repeat protein
MIQWHTGAKRVETLAFRPDGQLLASASYQGQVVKLWRPDGTPAGRVSVGFPVYDLAYSPDGQTLAVANGLTVTLYGPGETLHLSSGTGGGRTVAFRPDGQAVAVVIGGRGWQYRLPLKPLPRELDCEWLDLFSVSRLAYTRDGGRLLANCNEAVRVWALSGRAKPARVPHPPAGHIQTHVAVSPDGRLVAASHGRDISVWPPDDADARPVVLPGSKKSRSVRGMAFAPDGTLLAAGSDGLARRWDADAGAELETWDFGLKNLQSLAVSPDGLTAAAGSHDGRIVVWDL